MARRGGGRFTKPPLSSAELVQLMVRRGLVIDDVDQATKTLFHIGYYRLQPYCAPFEVPGSDHQFVPGTHFSDVLDLYAFDRHLRLLMLGGLARVEVAYRAALSEVMSKIDGDAHWYTKPSYFSDINDYKVLQGNVEQALDHPFPALADYVERYHTPELPPSWLMVEVLSIGQLNRVYRSLKRLQHQQAVARSLGLTDEILSSWMESFVRVRNICAHHERLWNAPLQTYPLVPHSDAVAWPARWHLLLEETGKTLYCVASALQSMLWTIDPGADWAAQLSALLQDRPMESDGMGFPPTWRDDPFWADAIEGARD